MVGGINFMLHIAANTHAAEGSTLEQSMANFLLAQALYLNTVLSHESQHHQGNIKYWWITFM